MSKIRNTSPARPRRGGRPLTARSVIASTLLGTHPPRMPTRLLVRTGELFGISAGTTRVAISRMVASGELEADDDGYRLAGALLARQSRQDTSRRAERLDWDRSWELAAVHEGARSAGERAELREATRRLKLGELREGTWTRPANLDPERFPAELAIVVAQCERFRATPERDSADLAASLWPLEVWAEDARSLVDELTVWGGRLEVGDVEAIAPAFVVSAAVLRHLLADPLLPDELLPTRWPGPELRDTYDAVNASFRELFGAWLVRQG